jgi:hypothetical protein
MQAKHPYAEILIAIANGEQIQWLNDAHEWIDKRHFYVLKYLSEGYESPSNYRIKHKTINININGIDVPEPVREPLEKGTRIGRLTTTRLTAPLG